MDTKTIAGGLALALSLVLGLFAVNKPATVVERTVVQPQNIGSVASPDINSPYLSVNGVRSYYNNQTLVTATTTVCAILSPVATSTLVSGWVSFTTSSTTASLVRLSKSSTPYASTTSLGVADLAAGAQGTLIASTTSAANATLDGLSVFGPSRYLVISMEGNVGHFSPTGRCGAVFQELTNVQ